MGGRVEKPLLEISGKSMLQRVIEVLRSSNSIDRIVVASTRSTPSTTAEAEKLGVQSIITPGDGFEEDMRFAIRHLSLADVLVISSDLPFVTVDVIKEALRKYRDAQKPALAVMAPTKLYESFGITPSYVFDINGRKLVPVGINIIDGGRIDEGALEQTELIIDSGDVAFNINTPEELSAARKKVAVVGGKEERPNHDCGAIFRRGQINR
jgi:adenosylcobinamide-phosphate guanylyltransferase